MSEAVDRYVIEQLVRDDPQVDPGPTPRIEVSPPQGKLLHLLARMTGARRVLELGTLAGYSTIWLARAVGPDGRVVTLELDPEFAAVARRNVDAAGVGERVEIVVGPALETLPGIDGPFDLVFIDADKAASPRYVEHALRVTGPGAVIVLDNVVRGGSLADAGSDDPAVRGMREAVELMGRDPRLDATVLQTVGGKGHDGFAVALRVD